MQRENDRLNPSKQYVDITQYPLIKSGIVHDPSPLLIFKYTIDNQQRLSVQCLVDRPVEVTYCVKDVIDVLLTNHGSMLCQYFSAFKRINCLNAIGSVAKNKQVKIIDFKPLWAIRRSMQQQTQKYLEKQSARLRPRKGQRIEVDSDQDDQGNILDEHEEGENIREEEADRQNTLSYIKCKPSITKQLNNPGSRQEGASLNANMAMKN